MAYVTTRITFTTTPPEEVAANLIRFKRRKNSKPKTINLYIHTATGRTAFHADFMNQDIDEEMIEVLGLVFHSNHLIPPVINRGTIKERFVRGHNYK